VVPLRQGAELFFESGTSIEAFFLISNTTCEQTSLQYHIFICCIMQRLFLGKIKQLSNAKVSWLTITKTLNGYLLKKKIEKVKGFLIFQMY
jgi:hypothetical protein